MIKLLQQHFQQTRIIHATYCRTVADLQPVKADKAELTKLADTLDKAVSWLEQLDQYNAGAILTSLATSTLPSNLSESWEEKTEDIDGVPDIKEFIRFVRR